MAALVNRTDCGAARQRELEAALAECRRALAADPNDAEAHTSLGSVLRRLGRLDEAVTAYRRAIELEPDRAGAHNELGTVRMELGWLDGAVAAYRRVVRLEPEFAEAHNNLGRALQELGRFDEAVAAHRRAIALKPGLADAHKNLGVAGRKLGWTDDAVAAYRSAVELEPDNPSFRFMLDAVTGGRPERAPEAYVSSLFDFYACRFDRHLVEALDYRGPQLLRDAVERRLGDSRVSWIVLDIGCGTGLCGPLFRRLARRLVGVDLSPRMIDKARERGVYDELHVAEITEYLARSESSVDLIVAADVLVYIGDLRPVLTNAHRALKANGLLAFFVEHADGDDFALASSGRFVHGRDYVAREAASAGFAIESVAKEIFRKEKDGPIVGDVYLMRRGA